MSARAILKNAPVSAQKARLIADMIRNKRVEDARDILAFNSQRPARLMGRLLKSAVSNAMELEANQAWHEGDEVFEDQLFVKRVTVDEGIRLKRMRPRARGMANSILRRRCHITLEVDDRS